MPPMRLRDALSLLRSLGSRAIVRRGIFIAGVALFERLLTPAAAWALFGRAMLEKVLLGFLLGAVFSVRTFAQHASKANTEADLLQRIVASLLEGDVLRANVLPDEDARAELGQAVFHATQTVAWELPLLVADVIAAALLTLLIVTVE